MNLISKYKHEALGAALWIIALIIYAEPLWAFTKFVYSDPLVAAVLAYWLYLAYTGYKGAKDHEKEIPLVATVMFAPVFLYGYPLDVALNTIVGSVLFAEKPWVETVNPLKWTFTARLKRWKNDSGWRGKQARFWASLLNPFELRGHV